MFAGLAVATFGITDWPTTNMSRPLRIFFFWGLSAFLALELMIPIHFASSRRYHSFDWAESSMRGLSDKTLRVLQNVKKPMQIKTIFDQGNMMQAPVFGIVSELLDQYGKANPNIEIEHVDPFRQKGRWPALKEEMDLPDMIGVVFQYEQKKELVAIDRLLIRPAPGQPQPETPEEVTAFYGEEEFTSAIIRVVNPDRTKFYFTTGHGELDIRNELAYVVNALRRSNYDVAELKNYSADIPKDCDVLLMLRPDPSSPLTGQEVGAIWRYLAGGGRLLFCAPVGGRTGLEPLLHDFGIHMADNIILVPGSQTPTLVEVAPFMGHEITENLRRFLIAMRQCRTVAPVPRAPGTPAQDSYRAYPLLYTNVDCWAETDIEGIIQRRTPSFDPAKDKRGTAGSPLTVAVFHEQPENQPDGTPYPKDRPRTRMVVVGCGDFMVGTSFGGESMPPPPGNVQFFLNVINWLAEKRELIAIAPKIIHDRPMDGLNERNMTIILWSLSAGMPGVFILIGGTIWFVRRRST